MVIVEDRNEKTAHRIGFALVLPKGNKAGGTTEDKRNANTEQENEIRSSKR